MGMYAVLLNHQLGAVIVDMNKGFRSIDFRQLNLCTDFGIIGICSGEKQMIGTDAEDISPVSQRPHMIDQGKLNIITQLCLLILHSATEIVDWGVAEYFRYFGRRWVAINIWRETGLQNPTFVNNHNMASKH